MEPRCRRRGAYEAGYGDDAAEENGEEYHTVLPTGYIDGPFPLPTTSSKPTTTDNPNNLPIYLSVVVPAYNESLRLPLMLTDAVTFLSHQYPYDPHSAAPTGWEILIIDDGSSDDTARAALDWTQNYLSECPPSVRLPPHFLRVVTLERNRGKGGAVTHGMRHFRGQFVVFADADGATQFSDLANLLAELQPKNGAVATAVPGVAVGSRAHMVHTAAVVQRSFVRNLLMYTFHAYLAIMGISAVKDTQCGFKLFERKAAREIFRGMHSEGWIFDVEVLLLADREGIKVVEVPVTWHEVEGTKMSLGRDSVKMAWDLAVLRVGYAVGVYGAGR